MNRRQLKVLTVIIPVLFGIVLLTGRDLVSGREPVWFVDLLAVGVLAAAAIVFSNWAFGLISHREAEIQRRTTQLAALHEASLILTTDLDLASVLKRVVRLAQGLVQARYGALGVLSEDRTGLDQFITSGLTQEEIHRIGQPPKGRGILGVVIQEGKPMRVDDLSADPRRAGLPPNHPPMRTFLGVPIRVKGDVIGNLYLTDKFSAADPDGRVVIPFTEEDEKIVEMFATQAGIAIENAQLYRKTQQLAVLQERERIGMDLHDGIIQSIYAVGLMLEDAQHRA
jgi:GAF domain-containing protein